MGTWVEMVEAGAGAVKADRRRVAIDRDRSAFDRGVPTGVECPRSGTGGGSHSFAQRLSRARLLYARRREAIYNWLALSLAMFIVLTAPSVPV